MQNGSATECTINLKYIKFTTLGYSGKCDKTLITLHLRLFYCFFYLKASLIFASDFSNFGFLSNKQLRQSVFGQNKWPFLKLLIKSKAGTYTVWINLMFVYSL